MLRDVDIQDISDGKLYTPEDDVPVGCDDCAGCSDCCRNTGDSIILDPRDMYFLTTGLHRTFEEMIEKQIEIRLVDGLILPNLMEHDENHPEQEDGCPFLNSEGRCSIHAIRPSFCRLFPMGRYYPDGEKKERAFYYIYQKGECSSRKRYPVRLRDWLDTPDLEQYELFTEDWHSFLRKLGPRTEMLTEQSADQVRRYVLQVFYVSPYRGTQSFYPQYALRKKKAERTLQVLL